MIFSTLAFGSVDTWAMGFLAIAAAFVGFLWLADARKKREFRFSSSLLQLPIVGLILLAAFQLLPFGAANDANLLNAPISHALTLDSFATKLGIIQLVVMLIFFASALTFINNQSRLRIVTTTLIIFGCAMAVFGLIQFFSDPAKIYWVREPFQANPFASFVNKHHFAGLMLMLTSLTLGLIYSKSLGNEKRPLLIFAVVLMGVAMVFTASRGALVSLLGVLAFLTLANLSRRESENSNKTFGGKLLLIGGGLSVILILLGGTLFLGGGDSVLRGVTLGAGQDDISNGRLHFWATTLEIIRDNPILGVGLEAFGVAYTKYDTWSGIYRIERAHNEYLNFLAETGFVGFALIVGFIVILLRDGLRVYNTTNDRFRRGVCLGALSGCVGILIHSFFDFPLHTPSNLLIFLTLAALATVTIHFPKLYRQSRSKN
ncbi:MAG: O-antigen ligase family protein [Pyrinomonadaceae bacterium]|nr:O-antigen ligase family protein [Pyrinomonadaceae bacterium]